MDQVTVQHDDVRLPRSFVPARYDIHLHADPANPAFRGTVRIHGRIEAGTRRIRLHAKGLTVTRAAAGKAEATVTHDAGREEASLEFASPLAAGEVALDVTYEGKVALGMAGLYLSKDGPDVCLATQCEATDARAILPCLDEPDRKASFAWTVTAPTGLTVLTNSPVESRRDGADGAGTTTWRFKPTAPMASYLVACAIGKFEGNETRTERGVPFRVWALGGKHTLGAFGRDFAVRLLPWYEDYFGQPYAFGKYDQVAIPSFAFGAMENAGLVTFRPSLILADPATASWDDKRDLCLVVAHEFAHMWFGDLVTMAWWDDLWLNEAFAEWMAHKAVASLSPELEPWTKFTLRAAGAMSTDAMGSTHAIYTPIRTPHEAAEMFDAITYGKGSATMRMLEAYLGEAVFRDGLRHHMAEFRFANATGADLWRNLGKASRQDVAGIMKDWITQPGHPQLTASWDAAASTLTLRQARARSSPLSKPEPTQWRVPVVLRYADDQGVHVERHLLSKPSDTVRLHVRGRLKWLWPNADDVGFYRCAVDDALLESLVANATTLAGAERVAVMRDLYFQLRNGTREPATVLAALGRLTDGAASYDVLTQTVGILRDLERILETGGRAEALAAYRAWVARRLQPAYAKLGRSGPADEDVRDRMRRALLLRAVAGIGREPTAVADARALAQAERREPKAVDATVAGTAVAVEAILGDAATLATDLAAALARRDSGSSPQEVERYLYVLPAFRAGPLVEAVLGELSSGKIAPQAIGPMLRVMLTEPHCQRQAWAYLKQNWATLKEKLGEAWIANLVEASGELTGDLAADVRAFWDANLAGMAGQAYGRCKERLVQRAEFLERVTGPVESWALTLRA